MSAQFFGQHLLEKSLVTPDQLLRAIFHQATVNLRLGEYAVRSSLLTPAKVTAVLAAQRRTDRLFGEQAVADGWLTPAQLEALLTRQKKERVRLGEVFVELKILTQATVNQAAAEYGAEQRATASSSSALPPNIINGKRIGELAHCANRLLLRVGGVIGKPGIASVVSHPLEPVHLEAWIHFTGSFEGRLVVRTPKLLALQVALCMTSGVARSTSEVADAIGEFCNIIAGGFCGRLDAEGRRTTIGAPQHSVEGSRKVLPTGPIALFPFYTAFGELQVAFEPRSP